MNPEDIKARYHAQGEHNLAVRELAQEHQTHDTQGRAYIRLGYIPFGSNRRRYIWAVQINDGMYMQVDSSGSWQFETAKGVQKRIIWATGGEVTRRAAGVSLKYAEMELI